MLSVLQINFQIHDNLFECSTIEFGHPLLLMFTYFEQLFRDLQTNMKKYIFFQTCERSHIFR